MSASSVRPEVPCLGADGDASTSQEDFAAALHSPTQRISSLEAARASDKAELASLRSSLSTPSSGTSSDSPTPLPYPYMRAYEKFLQDPHHSAERIPQLASDGSNYTEWLEQLNQVLCYVFQSDARVEGTPSLLENRPQADSRAICYLLNATIHPDVRRVLGIHCFSTNASDFFDAISSHFYATLQSQKNALVGRWCKAIARFSIDPQRSNHEVDLFFRKTFSELKCLRVDFDELESLFIQNCTLSSQK
ncbi:hypothetical protein O181_026112 [Austropuccinia psidii MF-1]|uniref:Uncharacterized protein n=1 Tax=Austropuccinia psidii MF-1 TaxID=1389203 RepID=A0A9Q3CMH1_9BASI|nr:hypothetical protein [Austropuccinia psidii MF-1]